MPDLRLGSVRPAAVKLGAVNVSKIYRGDTLLWPAAAPPCTDVLMEPFNDLASWSVLNTPTIVAGRTGTAVEANASADQAHYNLGANESATVTVGFALRAISMAGSPDMIRLMGDAGAVVQTQIRLFSNGSIQCMRGTGPIGPASAAGLIVLNTWYYIEVQATLHDTNGAMRVHINGTQVFNHVNVDTRAGGSKSVYDGVQLRLGALSSTLQWDDLYISTGTGCAFKGPITIP